MLADRPPDPAPGCLRLSQGIPRFPCQLQGVLLKRHKISGASGCQLAPQDVQVGQTVTAYGRTYHVTSVDSFTRQYLTERGISVAPDEQIPACPYDAWLAVHNTPGERTLNLDLSCL